MADFIKKQKYTSIDADVTLREMLNRIASGIVINSNVPRINFKKKSKEQPKEQVEDFGMKYFGVPSTTEPELSAFQDIEEQLLNIPKNTWGLFDPVDYYNAKYEKYGGLKGLRKLRETNKINQAISPHVMEQLGAINTLNEYVPIDNALKSSPNALKLDTDTWFGSRVFGLGKDKRIYMNDPVREYYANKIDNATTSQDSNKYVDLLKQETEEVGSILAHELTHGIQNMSLKNMLKYKGNRTDDLKDYMNQQNEMEARTVEVQREAMNKGIEPVYDQRTRAAFEKWLESDTGTKSLNRHKVTPQVVRYLIDKIVSNDNTEHDIKDILLNSNEYV